MCKFLPHLGLCSVELQIKQVLVIVWIIKTEKSEKNVCIVENVINWAPTDDIEERWAPDSPGPIEPLVAHKRTIAQQVSALHT